MYPEKFFGYVRKNFLRPPSPRRKHFHFNKIPKYRGRNYVTLNRLTKVRNPHTLLLKQYPGGIF